MNGYYSLEQYRTVEFSKAIAESILRKIHANSTYLAEGTLKDL